MRYKPARIEVNQSIKQSLKQTTIRSVSKHRLKVNHLYCCSLLVQGNACNLQHAVHRIDWRLYVTEFVTDECFVFIFFGAQKVEGNY